MFQATIRISKGKIIEIKQSDGYVELIIDGKTHSYPNCYASRGFVDSHGHIAALGSKLNGLNLYTAKSAEECIELARVDNSLRGYWLTGKGWNNELWKNTALPNINILDDTFADIPVCFFRVDGHAVWVNSEALKIAGINSNTHCPVGGFIEKDKSGNPTGILHDNAMDMITVHIPNYSNTQLTKNILDAMNELVKKGITEVHDLDLNPEFVDIYMALNSEGKLPLRIQSYIKGHNDEWLKQEVKLYNSNFFNIVGVKLYADGSLGSRSAAMLEPYSDAPDTKGIFLSNSDKIFIGSKWAIENGFHIAIHAIGDAANRMVLNTYKRLYDDNIADENSILRLEHAQHVHPDDIKIFSKYKIIASIQPIHCISDAATISEKRIGKRCEFAYPWQSLAMYGAVIIAGSDFPIESHNPFWGIDAFVQRKPNNSKDSWFPKQRLTQKEALDAYCNSPLSVMTNSNKQGELKVNMNADITIIDRDILNCDETQIRDTKVIATILDGDMKYQQSM